MAKDVCLFFRGCYFSFAATRVEPGSIQWKGLLCETWSVSHLWNGHIRHVDEVGNSSNLLELTPQRSMMVHASHWEKTWHIMTTCFLFFRVPPQKKQIRPHEAGKLSRVSLWTSKCVFCWSILTPKPARKKSGLAAEAMWDEKTTCAKSTGEIRDMRCAPSEQPPEVRLKHGISRQNLFQGLTVIICSGNLKSRVSFHLKDSTFIRSGHFSFPIAKLNCKGVCRSLVGQDLNHAVSPCLLVKNYMLFRHVRSILWLKFLFSIIPFF